MNTSIIYNQLIERNALVFDVGANDGQFALQVARSQAYSGTIYCFEPVREIYSKLSHNLSDYPDCIPINRAIGDTCGFLEIYKGSREDTYQASTLNFETANPALYGEVIKEKVECETLDTFSMRFDLIPNFIKLDVERYEQQAILGGSRLLFANQPIIYFEWGWTELETPTIGEHFRFLQAISYKLFVADVMRFNRRWISFEHPAISSIICEFDNYFFNEYSKQVDGALNILALPESKVHFHSSFLQQVSGADFLNICKLLSGN
jgi:FkbM family methyltransferase